MVTDKFINKLKRNIRKDLGDALAGEPIIQIFGSEEDQGKGYVEQLFRYVLPLGSASYQAKQFLLCEIPIQNSLFNSIFFTTSIFNVEKRSIQSHGTLMTYCPFPVAETYLAVERFRSCYLLPLRFFEKKYNSKQIERISASIPPLKEINNNKNITRKLKMNKSLTINSSGFSDSFDISVDKDLDANELQLIAKYMTSPTDESAAIFRQFTERNRFFSIKPYINYSIMTIRDCGKKGAKVNHPRYDFKKYFFLFSQVARTFTKYPQGGTEIGHFEEDPFSTLLFNTIMDRINSMGSVSSSPAYPSPQQTSQVCNQNTPPFPTPQPVHQHPQSIAGSTTIHDQNINQEPAQNPHPPTSSASQLQAPPNYQLISCPGCSTALQIAVGQPAFVCPHCQGTYQFN